MADALEGRVQALEAQLRTQNAKKSKTDAKANSGFYKKITKQTVASGAATVSWTSVSVGNHVPHEASAVYGSCRLNTGALVADTTFTIDGRSDASDSTRNLLTVYGIVGVAPDAGGGSSTFILPILNGTLQYQVTGGVNPASWDITIEGYFL
jgi:hypothetical protein